LIDHTARKNIAKELPCTRKTNKQTTKKKKKKKKNKARGEFFSKYFKRKANTHISECIYMLWKGRLQL